MPARGAQVVIDSGVTLLVDPREPGPVRMAARDLARDMQTVFGRAVRVVEKPEAASGTVIAVAYAQHLPKAVTRPTGWEVLRIQAVANPWPGTPVRQAVVLTGSDVRGTIYAIYEFSQRFLNVDPLYWWTDNPPARRDRVTVPEDFALEPPSPTFHYRGWFINDEDLLTAWRPGTADKTGIALDVWDHLYESLLRLKGDMIIPNTYIFPYEPQVRTAGQRGLIISQHHGEPLGLSVYQWPKEVPYSMDRLTAAWRCAVSQYAPDQEVIWTVGLRGRYDRPFWEDITNAPKAEAGRARMIREAINRQMEIVRRQRPTPPPEFILNTWMEGSGLLRGGALELPPEVVRVWADNGRGMLEDGGKIGRRRRRLLSHGRHRTQRQPFLPAGAGRPYRPRVGPRRQGRRHALPAAQSVRHPAGDDDHPRGHGVGLGRPAVDRVAGRCERGVHGAMVAGGVRRRGRAGGGAVLQGLFRRPRALCQPGGRNHGRRVPAVVRPRVAAAHHSQRRDLAHPLRLSESQGHESLRRPSGRDLPRGRAALAAGVPAGRAGRAACAGRAARLLSVPRAHSGPAEHARQPDVAGRGRGGLAGAGERRRRFAKIDEAMGFLRAIQADLRAAEYGQWAGFYTLGDWFVDIPLTLRLAEVCRTHLAGRPLSPAQQETLDTAVRINRENTSYVFIKIKAYQEGQKVKFRESPGRN